MANEIQTVGPTGKTLYATIRNSVGQIWNTNSSVFQTYATASYAQYPITLTEQGTASGVYLGTVPAAITSPGVLSIVVYQQVGGSPAETDPSLAMGNIEWSGSIVNYLGQMPTSGQLAALNQSMVRGHMIQNFPFKLVSAADHVTPFTSGVVSGQIRRDGGAFGALQSGSFTELGMGWYSLGAFTSGDMNAKTVAVTFRANNISGQGVSDPRDFTFVLQTSGGN